MRKFIHGIGTAIDVSEAENVALVAISPAEAKLIMHTCLVNQSKLYDQRHAIEEALKANAALYQRFADVWQNELDAIENRLEKQRHEEAQRLAAQRVEETPHSVSNGSANPTDN